MQPKQQPLHLNWSGFIKAIPEAVLCVNREGFILTANDWADQLFGYPTGDLAGKNISILMPEAMREEHKDYVANYQPGPNKRRMENMSGSFYGIKKDGTKFPVEISLNGIQEGESFFILTVIRDITYGRMLESQLTENEKIAEEILSSLSVNIAVLNKEGFIIAVNKGWEHFVQANGKGVTGGLVKGDNYFAACNKAYKEGSEWAGKALTGIQSVLAGELGYFEMECKGMEGKDESWFLMRAVPFESREKGVVISYNDISELKKVEVELYKRNTEVMKINKELDQFVYSISHDLRAPLASALGLLDLVEHETEPGAIVQYMAMLKESLNKMDGTIQEILDYSKNVRTELLMEELDMAGLIEDVFKSTELLRSDTNISRRKKVTGDIPFWNDRLRIRFILNNLISNAIKYSKSGHSDSFIQVEAIITPKEIKLMVQDNGIGVEKEQHDRIFKMFYRATSLSSGSGLGLYITRECVNRLGGTILVDSEPGVGTTFTVTVPNLYKLSLQ